MTDIPVEPAPKKRFKKRRLVLPIIAILVLTYFALAAGIALWSEHGQGPDAPRIGLSVSNLWYDEMRAHRAPYDVAIALYEACRYPEAHQTTKDLTNQFGKDAGLWSFRGQLALQAGDPADASRSFLQAISLDPKVELPSYAKGIK